MPTYGPYATTWSRCHHMHPYRPYAPIWAICHHMHPPIWVIKRSSCGYGLHDDGSDMPSLPSIAQDGDDVISSPPFKIPHVSGGGFIFAVQLSFSNFYSASASTGNFGFGRKQTQKSLLRSGIRHQKHRGATRAAGVMDLDISLPWSQSGNHRNP